MPSHPAARLPPFLAAVTAPSPPLCGLFTVQTTETEESSNHSACTRMYACTHARTHARTHACTEQAAPLSETLAALHGRKVWITCLHTCLYTQSQGLDHMSTHMSIHTVARFGSYAHAGATGHHAEPFSPACTSTRTCYCGRMCGCMDARMHACVHDVGRLHSRSRASELSGASSRFRHAVGPCRRPMP